MDPWGFFIWDEFIDPGKPCQCPRCGTLMDEECIEWNEELERNVCVCPDCGTGSDCQPGPGGRDHPDC